MSCDRRCLETGTGADCVSCPSYQELKRKELDGIKPPRKVKRYNVTAAIDLECSIGRRRESKEELR